MSGFFTYLTHEENVIQQALMTASDPDTDFPASNAKELPVGKPARIGAISSASIRFDLPVENQPTIFAIINHNMTSGATITLNGGTAPDPDGSAFTTTLTWRRENIYKNIAPAAAYRYWKLIVTDIANPYGFIQIGYLAMGSRTAFGFGFKYGWRLEHETVNTENVTERGVMHVASLYERDLISLEFESLSKTEGVQVQDFYYDLTKSLIPFVLVPEENEVDVYFGRLTNNFEKRVGFGERAEIKLGFVSESRGQLILDEVPFHYEA